MSKLRKTTDFQEWSTSLEATFRDLDYIRALYKSILDNVEGGHLIPPYQSMPTDCERAISRINKIKIRINNLYDRFYLDAHTNR